MTPAEKERALLITWFKGNEAAAALVEQWFYVCHLWDDLIDMDTSRAPEEINAAFWTLAMEIPSNSFYQEHGHRLRPVMATHIIDWMAANNLEAGKVAHDAHIAYTLRCNIMSLIGLIATLIGGVSWGALVQTEARRYGQRETLGTYLADLSIRHGRFSNA